MNSYSRKCGDEEATMLLVDGKIDTHFKNSIKGVAEDTERAD